MVWGANGKTTGLVGMGADYSCLSLVKEPDGLHLVQLAAAAPTRATEEMKTKHAPKLGTACFVGPFRSPRQHHSQ
jgi:hypothetical protein